MTGSAGNLAGEFQDPLQHAGKDAGAPSSGFMESPLSLSRMHWTRNRRARFGVHAL